MRRSLGAGTIAYPTPVFIVGTYDARGMPNIMAAAWGGICCSRPPSIAVALRKATYTYGNIVARRAFTISIPDEGHVVEADYAGVVSGAKEDKFAAAGLTAVRSELVDAPYVGEFPLALECKLVQAIELGLHTQFVGEILDVKADESMLNADGRPDVAKIRPFMFDPGTSAYYGISRLLGKAFAVGRKLVKNQGGS